MLGQPFVYHYNGSTFTPVSLPTFKGGGALTGMTTLSQGGIMAVGVLTPTTGTTSPLALKGDYLNGLILASPLFVGNNSRLNAAITLPDGDVFAVGNYLDNGVGQGFGEDYHCGTPAPPPTPNCPINFTDVHPSDYFNTPVNFLYCWNAISGYPASPPCPSGQAPCFRPYNTTTRGQLTKIITLGFAIPVVTPTPGPSLPGKAPSAAGYTFADVLPGSTFYQYVEQPTPTAWSTATPAEGRGSRAIHSTALTSA